MLSSLAASDCRLVKRQPPPCDPAAFCVAAYGDSMTLGLGASGGWPTALPDEWVRFDGGVDAERAVPTPLPDGSLPRTGTRRPTTEPELTTLATSWDVVVMMWGTNDVLYPGWDDDLLAAPADWVHETPDDLMNDLEGAAMTLRASGLRVVVAWPPPILPSGELASVANVRLQRLVAPLRARLEAGGATFVDLFTAFSASPELPDPSIYYADPVHWNLAGEARAGALIADAILAGCPAGYTGERCETNVDDCAAAPCQNGGACTDGVDAFTCTCPPGFTGAACEVAESPYPSGP